MGYEEKDGKIIVETIDDREKVVMSKEKFKTLCKEYGVYGIDWYLMGYISNSWIKYFDDKNQEWRWTRYW